MRQELKAFQAFMAVSKLPLSTLPSSSSSSSSSSTFVHEYLVETFCGLDAGIAGFVDGPPSKAQYNSPSCVLVLPNGLLLVSERDNNSLRLIGPDGVVSTLVGRGGAGHVDGDVSQARLSRPKGL
jgi:hypothetical protein